MADDKKKRAALRRALEEGRSKKTGAKKVIPKQVLRMSAKYGKDGVKDPRVAARNEDQERGANLKKVKVKAKTVATKKASPVKSGKMSKAPEKKSRRRKSESVSNEKKEQTKVVSRKGRKVKTKTTYKDVGHGQSQEIKRVAVNNRKGESKKRKVVIKHKDKKTGKNVSKPIRGTYQD